MHNQGLTRTLAINAMLFTALSLSAQTTDQARQAVKEKPEPPPVFRIQEVLDAEIIQGPDYVIAQDVPVRGYKFLFTIRTSYGEIQAHGRNMLELRLREMYAIENARQLVKDPQLIKGIVETFKQTPSGIGIIITDPGGTLLRAPKGLKRMATNLVDRQNARAGGEERRQFAMQIGCDPETTNPVLAALLDNLAVRRSAGKVSSNLGMNLALPGLGLLSTTKDFKDQLVKQSPAETNARIESELLEMGVWQPIARQFCRERSYTTLYRLIFMNHLRALKNVTNYQYLVYRATNAYDEAEGLGMVREMQILRRLHEQHGVTQIDLQGLPVALLQDGTVVIVNASDYIYDSQELHDAIAAFRRARPNDPGIFITAGKVSPRAKKTLNGFNLQVAESGNTTLVETVSQ